MPRYAVFSADNSYITPYASSTDGGELISEFNLRSALNVIGWKTVNIEDLKISYDSYMTGTRRDTDLRMSRTGGNLVISRGRFLIRGYYCELNQAIAVPIDDLITMSELIDSTSKSVRKYVKIRIIVSPDLTTHGERVIPPSNGYYGLDLVVDSVLPDEYDLLLGWVIRTNTETGKDSFTITNNPSKSRILDLDKLTGAEHSGDWVMPPTEKDGNIYGIEKKNDGVLTDISDWLWLAYNSPLGRYLRNFAWNATDADNGYIGKTNHKGRLLGCIVSFNEDDATGSPIMFHAHEEPDSYTLDYRILKAGSKASDAYDVKSLNIPLATYTGRNSGIEKEVLGEDYVSGKAGLLSASTLKYIDTVLRGTENWAPKPGVREFGPFQTTAAANDWFRKHPDITLQVGDYYWVLDDTYNDTLKSVFGAVSGTAETVIMGVAPSSTASLSLSIPSQGISGSIRTQGATVHLKGNPEDKVIFNLPDIPIWGDVEGSLSTSSVSLTTEAQNVSFGVEIDPVTIEIEDPESTITGTGTGTGEGTVPSLTIPASISSSEISGNVSGTIGSREITADAPEFDIDVGVEGEIQSDIEIEPMVTDITGQIGQMTVQATGQVAFNGTMDSYTQNVSARYVYMKDWDNSTDTREVYGWFRQCVLRGFATPATYDYYGFVRPNSKSVPGGIIMDDTGHLKLRDEDINALDMAGWKICEESQLSITPEGEGLSTYDCPASLEGVWFINPVTIILKGEGWDSNTVVPLNRMRGDITLDITQAVPAEGASALINCNDVNKITIQANIDKNTLTSNKINVNDCIVTTHNFNSIHRWLSSRFDSGSNVATVDNPWVTIDNPFTNEYDNTIQTRFVTITRGEYGIVSGELDIWVKIPDWTTSEVNESVRLKSMEKLKFPPFLIRLDDNGNIAERQDIPSNSETLLKVSGTGGTHRIYQTPTDEDSDSYILSGNFVCTVDWRNEDYFSLAGRVLNESGDRNHGLFDVRFRALVQFVDSNDSVAKSIQYTAVYPS